MSDNSRRWTLHYRSHSMTVQLRTLLLRHSSSYAADCSHRTKQLLLHVLLTHCSRDTLSESSYKQKSGRKLYSSHAWSWEKRELSMSKFSLWLIYSTCRNAETTTTKNKCVSTTQQCRPGKVRCCWENSTKINGAVWTEFVRAITGTREGLL